MSKSDAFETALLSLIFNGDTITGIADDTATAPVTSLYVSLHTADPGEAGNQSTNEIAYTSYARAAVARTSGGWTITGSSVSPVAAIEFPEGTGGSGTATHFGIGTAASGAGVLLYSGALDVSVVCGDAVQPVLKTTTAITED